MLEQITGFLTSAESAANMTSDLAGGMSAGLPDTVLYTVAIILLIILGWFIIMGIASLVLFIISCVKQNIPLTDLLKRSFGSFKALYRPMFKYYLPLIILSFFVGVFNLATNLLDILSDVYPNLAVIYALVSLVAFPFVIANAIYVGVLDSSLAKSYYNSLKTRKFSFSWISAGEYFRLIWLSILYFLIIIASLLLLGIPLLFLPAISLFLRYPILNEGKSAGATIKKLINMLKKDFWNLMFLYAIYGLIVGAASVITYFVPVLGYVAIVVVVTPISTLFTAEAYNLLNKGYEKGGYKTTKRG